MKIGAFWELGGVSDEQLRSGLATLLASGYRTEARIVAHIAEVEERRLHSKEGSSSLFEYCVKQLGLSESEAFHRLTAARIARRFTAVFAMLERREVHLTAVCLLRDYLTPENHRELLAEASHKTKFQVQELLARRFPRPDVVSRIRKLPAHAQPAKQASTLVSPQAPIPATAPHEAARLSSPARGSVEPTSEARYRIQLNASASLKEKLELFQALVSHSVPNGDIAAVLERALDLALEQAQKQRFAKTERPRSLRARAVKRMTSHREHIPNSVQREVAARDGLRCTYVSDTGCRCSARAFLQIHHEHPWARGGTSSAANLRLLCASHNRLLAERDFGTAYVAERRAARRRSDERPSTIDAEGTCNIAAVGARSGAASASALQSERDANRWSPGSQKAPATPLQSAASIRDAPTFKSTSNKANDSFTPASPESARKPTHARLPP